MPTFGERLKQLRQEKSLTINESANQFGIQYRSYQRYESNNSTPKYELLIQIADYYNVSLDWLTGRSNERDIQK